MIRSRIPACALILVSVLLVSAQGVDAQGMYLERGTSGFGFSAGYATNEDVSGCVFSAGGSASGTVDLGISVGRLSFDVVGPFFDLKSTAISPFLTIHALKQNDTMPFSFALGGSYEWDSYSSDILTKTDIEMKGWSYSFGGSVYSAIPMSSNLDLIPTVGVSYTQVETEYEDTFGNSISEDDGVTTFSFGLNISVTLPENQRFFVSPGVATNEDNTTFSIGLGFVFPTSKFGWGI